MRFRLETLFLAILLFAVSVAAFGPCLGSFSAAGGVTIVGAVFSRRWRMPKPLTLMVLLPAFGLLVSAVHFQLRTAWRLIDPAPCLHNLQALGMALRMYEQQYSSLPPAYVADASGKPEHSWRVLLLPYLDQSAVFARYRFTEPWNGPNNGPLAVALPWSYFHCPAVESSPSRNNYFAVVGPGTTWPGTQPTSLDDIHDGTSNTILLIEADGLDISWTEPRDLTLTELAAGYQAAGKKGLSTPHPDEKGRYFQRVGAVNVLLADGSVRSLSRKIPPETLRALLTINGGEPIDWDAIDALWTDEPVPFWWAAPLSLLVAYALLIWRLWVEKQRGEKGAESVGG